MKRVLILVEGQTEERFVKDMLSETLWPRGVTLVPKIVTTKRVKKGPDFKGGLSDYQKVENDLRRLLGDSGAAAITTFLDYYGLPHDFPGMGTRPSAAAPVVRARHVEAAWEARMDHQRFRAYLMVHEFESLLFANPEEVCRALYAPEAVADLQAVRASFPSPEEINDNPLTAPSKRLQARLPAYQKTVHGPLAARRTGLDALRRECRHFGKWLAWLEGL
jgi:hypothetical protein